MQIIKKFLKQELSGWTTAESLFFVMSCLAICICSVLAGDTILGIVSSISGVIYTLCNGKGKRIAYIFGLINSLLFAIIAFQNTIYGDAALYALYYVPAMIIGFVLWTKNFNPKNLEIKRQKMKLKSRIVLFVICTVSVIAGWLILSLTSDVLPLTDSFTTTIQIIATVLAVKRFYEQWILWTAANIVEVVLWSIRLLQGAENAAVSLVMFIVFLIVGVKMWIDWHKKC